MDDALWREIMVYTELQVFVLILVLMDDALWHKLVVFDQEVVKRVLILVLMDDALWQQNTGFALFKGILRLFCAS